MFIVGVNDLILLSKSGMSFILLISYSIIKESVDVLCYHEAVRNSTHHAPDDIVGKYNVERLIQVIAASIIIYHQDKV